jgi:hypothetical protein
MNEVMSGYLKFDIGVGSVKVVVEEADSGIGISRGEWFLNEECSSRPSPFELRTAGGLNRCGIDGLASEHELDRATMGADKATLGGSYSRILDLAESLDA